MLYAEGADRIAPPSAAAPVTPSSMDIAIGKAVASAVPAQPASWAGSGSAQKSSVPERSLALGQRIRISR
jgi:hypothetical protein